MPMKLSNVVIRAFSTFGFIFVIVAIIGPITTIIMLRQNLNNELTFYSVLLFGQIKAFVGTLMLGVSLFGGAQIIYLLQKKKK